MINPDEMEMVYRRLREKMIFYAEGRGCTDPEGVVDEALYRAFVEPGFRGRQVDNIDAYAFGCVKMVMKEWFRKASRTAPIDELDAGFESQPSEEFLDLTVALDKLPPDNRELLVRYYGHGETAEDLAPRFRLTPSGIRVRILNIRAEMRRLLSPVSGRKINKNVRLLFRHTPLEA